MNILKYREYIDTECSSHQHKILNKKALKLDGDNSLKMAIGCKDLKSCDYLKYKKDKILLIEISDLTTQMQELIQKTSCITEECKDTLGKKLQKKLKPEMIIKEELREKYLQTTLILHKLEEHVKFSFHKSKIFIIAICSNRTSDVMAFQYLINDLKACLQSFFEEIKIVLAKDLVRVI